MLRRNRQKRQQYREFFVEGVRPLNQAVAHGWMIRSFYYSSEKGLSDWAKDLLAHSEAHTHFDLRWPLLQKLSAKTDTSELIAVVAIPDDDLTRIPIRPNLLVVVFDRAASPGNLGTLIRSCDALHADGVVVTGHSVDLYDPETVSASRGSLFTLPVVRLSSQRELLPWLATIRQELGQMQIVGSSEKAGRDIWDQDFSLPTVLLVGNETWGLSAAYRELSTTMARIPIGGSASSLNVACAASIILYEIDRQRRMQAR